MSIVNITEKKIELKNHTHSLDNMIKAPFRRPHAPTTKIKINTGN